MISIIVAFIVGLFVGEIITYVLIGAFILESKAKYKKDDSFTRDYFDDY